MVHDYAMGTAGTAQLAVPDGAGDSEQFRRKRDEEQQELVFEAQHAAEELIDGQRDKLDEFAKALLERDVLERGDIDRIMAGVPRMERHPGLGLRVMVARPHEEPEGGVRRDREE